MLSRAALLKLNTEQATGILVELHKCMKFSGVTTDSFHIPVMDVNQALNKVLRLLHEFRISMSISLLCREGTDRNIDNRPIHSPLFALEGIPLRFNFHCGVQTLKSFFYTSLIFRGGYI